jgi:hypothetical protein
MKPADLIRRIRRLATKRQWTLVEREGQGAHLKVWLNGRLTIISRHRGEMRPGTFRKVLSDLGLTERDLEDV